MKIVNKRKFVRSIVLVVAVIFGLIFMFGNKTFSLSEKKYEKVFASSGDTLWSIAKEQKNNNAYFEDKDIRAIVDEIKYTNNMNNSDLQVGQELSIPTI